MDILEFTENGDPDRMPRLGVPLKDERTLVDLQAGHTSMRGRPTPFFSTAEQYRAGGPDARAVAEEVVGWVIAQRPPGTLTTLDHVHVKDRVVSD